MKHNKINNLEELKNRIKQECKNKVFFFPEYGEVKGYFGIKNIMFVAENPIKRNPDKEATEEDEKDWKPSSNDKILYTTLKKFGFGNAHLTDLVKLRKTQKEAKEFFKNIKEPESQKTFLQQIDYLKEEYKIIQPKIIVAMTRRCEKYLIEFFGKGKVRYVFHYSHVGRYNKIEKYHEQLKKIKEEYEK